MNGVYNEQSPKRFNSSGGLTCPDDEIANRAISLLRWRPRYDCIRVTARNGRLTLSGEVYWDSDREAAECTVRKLSGVTGVTNLITTKDIRR